MKQISKTDFARIQDYAKKLDDIRNLIDEIVDEAQQRVFAAMEDLNNYVDEANGFIGDMFNEAESYYDERSDQWRDGDNGQQYYEWMGEIETAASDLISRDFDIDASDILQDIDAMKEALENIRQSPQE